MVGTPVSCAHWRRSGMPSFAMIAAWGDEAPSPAVMLSPTHVTCVCSCACGIGLGCGGDEQLMAHARHPANAAVRSIARPVACSAPGRPRRELGHLAAKLDRTTF